MDASRKRSDETSARRSGKQAGLTKGMERSQRKGYSRDSLNDGRNRGKSPGRSSRSPSPKENKGTFFVSQPLGNTVYISNVSKTATDKDIYNKFAEYGKIVKISSVRDPETKEPKGYAFITYEDVEDANQAISSSHKTSFFGQYLLPVTVAQHDKGGEGEKGNGKFGSRADAKDVATQSKASRRLQGQGRGRQRSRPRQRL